MLPDAAIAISNATHVAEARRVALDLAYDAGFNEEVRGNRALVLTELATNLMQHAKGGTIVFRQLTGAALVAGVLFRDRRRMHDDATVVALRI